MNTDGRQSGDPGAAPDANYVRLLNLLALGQIGLFLTTRIWFPPFEFPQVPLFGFCRHWPVAVEYAAFFGSLAGTFFARTSADKPTRRLRHGICAVSFAVLFAMNQHRLQPWAYQFFVLHAWLALAAPRWKLVGWRWLVISIYFYSALSKVDYAFCTNHGPFLIDGFLHAFGIAQGTANWPDKWRFLAAAALPAAELLAAGLLCVQRTRPVGRWLSVLMHLALISALGPWGHDHSAGVLIWNAFFIVQNWLLFTTDRGASSAAVRQAMPPDRRLASWGAWGVLGTALVAPLGEPFGLWDHWPSWAVYAARPERTQVYVHEEELDRIPDELRRHIAPPTPLDPWRLLRIERWSLDAARVPIYPQSRFSVGIAWAVAERHHLTAIKLIIDSPPDRWTGRRTAREFVGLDAIRNHAMQYRLNAFPRSNVRNEGRPARRPHRDGGPEDRLATSPVRGLTPSD